MVLCRCEDQDEELEAAVAASKQVAADREIDNLMVVATENMRHHWAVGRDLSYLYAACDQVTGNWQVCGKMRQPACLW